MKTKTKKPPSEFVPRWHNFFFRRLMLHFACADTIHSYRNKLDLSPTGLEGGGLSDSAFSNACESLTAA